MKAFMGGLFFRGLWIFAMIWTRRKFSFVAFMAEMGYKLVERTPYGDIYRHSDE